MKKIVKYMVFATILLISLPFILFGCLYIYGGMLMPREPLANDYTPWPPIINGAIWAAFSEDGPTYVTPLNPWNIIGHLLLDFTIHGNMVTTYVSSRLLDAHNRSQGMFIHHLQIFSLDIRLSRDWTSEQIIRAAGEHVVICRTIRGIGNIANQFFDKQTSGLKASEIALIMAGTKGGITSKESYQIEQLQKRRNHILEGMFKNGGITETEFSESSDQPINSIQRQMVECLK